MVLLAKSIERQRPECDQIKKIACGAPSLTEVSLSASPQYPSSADVSRGLTPPTPSVSHLSAEARPPHPLQSADVICERSLRPPIYFWLGYPSQILIHV